MKGEIVIMPKKALIILMSYHHRNTEKVAHAISDVLGAEIKSPREVLPEEIQDYDLIGFGSGIYNALHHKTLLDLVDRLPVVKSKQAFLFSTNGAPPFIGTERFTLSNHSVLKNKLTAKGFEVIGDFGCAGFNTNSFLKRIGGLNKGRPNAEDLQRAKEFARELTAT